jgi:hypothetical protein
MQYVLTFIQRASFQISEWICRKLSLISDSATTQICSENYTEIIARWRFNSASERSTNDNKLNCMTKDKLLLGALWILRKVLVTVNTA